MTVDLWMLVASAGLCWALIMLAALPAVKDPKVGLGNRDDLPEPTGLFARAGRASGNLKENLPLFAILVLVAHVSGSANETTALGAQIFLGARVGHALIYIAGIPGLRTLIWSVSIAGMAMIASALF